MAASQSARSQTCRLRCCARGSLGKSSSSSSLKTLAQLGSRKMNGRPASICGAMRSRTLREISAGGAKEAEVVERAAAADVSLRGFDVESGLGEDRFGSGEGLRVVVVVPGVRPEHHLRWGSISAPELWQFSTASALGQSLAFWIALRRQAGQLPFAGDAGDALDQRAGEGAGEHGVCQRRGQRALAGEPVGKSEDVVVERVQAALVALGQELGFVGGHVHLDGALGFAGLATEAEVEGLVDGVALEAFLAQGSGEHLPEQAGAAAGGVLLLAGGAVAGAHDAALRCCGRRRRRRSARWRGRGSRRRRQMRSEFPGSQNRDPSSAPGRLWGTRVRGMAEIFHGVVDADGIDELAGIHAVAGIPERLELAEGLHELGAEHFGQQGGARLAVAVLAGERAAEAEDDIGGAVDELAEVAHAFSVRKSKLMRMCTQPWP